MPDMAVLEEQRRIVSVVGIDAARLSWGRTRGFDSGRGNHAPAQGNLFVMDASLKRRVLELYADVDRQVATAGPVCVASGRCCRFKEYDHTLFISGIEADVLLAAAPPYDPAAVTADFCPFQDGNLCTAREPRPLGCRVYYCDPSYTETCHAISEKYLR